MNYITRILPKNLLNKWQNPAGLIQVFMGPRQVSKTTTANLLADSEHTIFFSADAPAPPR